MLAPSSATTREESPSGGQEKSVPPPSPKSVGNAQKRKGGKLSKARVSAAIAFVQARNAKSKDENEMILESPRGQRDGARLPLTPTRMNSPAREQSTEKSFFSSHPPPANSTKDSSNSMAAPSPSSSIGMSSPGRRSRRLAAARYAALSSARQSGPGHALSRRSQTTVDEAKVNDNSDEASTSSSETSLDANVMLGLADFIDSLNKTSSSTSDALIKDEGESDAASSMPAAVLDSDMLKNLGDFIDRLHHQNVSKGDDNDAILISSSSSDGEDVDPETLQQIASYIDTLAKTKSAADMSQKPSIPEDVLQAEPDNLSAFVETSEKSKEKPEEQPRDSEISNQLLASREHGLEQKSFVTTTSANVEAEEGVRSSESFSSPKSSLLNDEVYFPRDLMQNVDDESCSDRFTEINGEAIEIGRESGSFDEIIGEREKLSQAVASLDISSSEGTEHNRKEFPDMVNAALEAARVAVERQSHIEAKFYAEGQKKTQQYPEACSFDVDGGIDGTSKSSNEKNREWNASGPDISIKLKVKAQSQANVGGMTAEETAEEEVEVVSHDSAPGVDGSLSDDSATLDDILSAERKYEESNAGGFSGNIELSTQSIEYEVEGERHGNGVANTLYVTTSVEIDEEPFAGSLENLKTVIGTPIASNAVESVAFAGEVEEALSSECSQASEDSDSQLIAQESTGLSEALEIMLGSSSQEHTEIATENLHAENDQIMTEASSHPDGSPPTKINNEPVEMSNLDCSRHDGVGNSAKIQDDNVGPSRIASSDDRDDDQFTDINGESIEISNEASAQNSKKFLQEGILKALEAGESSEGSQTISKTISEDRESYLLNAFLAGSYTEISVDPIIRDFSTMKSIDEDDNIARFQERAAVQKSSNSGAPFRDTGDLTQINGNEIEITKDSASGENINLIAERMSKVIGISMDESDEEDHKRRLDSKSISSAGTSSGIREAESKESYLFNAFLLGSLSEISVDPILPDPSTMKSLDEDENIERFLAKAFTLPEGSTKEELLMLNTFIKEVTNLMQNESTPEQRQNVVKKAICDGLPKDVVEEVIVCLVCGPDYKDAENGDASSGPKARDEIEALLDGETGTELIVSAEPTSYESSLSAELDQIVSGIDAREEESPTQQLTGDADHSDIQDVTTKTTVKKDLSSVEHEADAIFEAKILDKASARDEIDVMDTFIDKLAPRKGASANEIELLNQFMKLAAPVLSGNVLSKEEEAKLRHAAGGVGISEELLDELLRKTKDGIMDNQSETKPLSNDMSLNAISSSIEVDAEADAVEVSFDMSYSKVKDQLIDDLEGDEEQEDDWFKDITHEADPTSGLLNTTEKRQMSKLTVETDAAIANEGNSGTVWSPVEDFLGERYAVPATPPAEIHPPQLSQRDPSFGEMAPMVSPRSRLPRHRSKYSPTAKTSVSPSRLGGSAAAAVISRWSPRRYGRRRLPLKQQWKLSYRERTKSHAGYFEVDIFSLQEMSASRAAPHHLDNIPWEDREVKQRFLHEQSVSFSRNWFGKMPRMRGNDKYREPVARPDSMAMPMTHHQDHDWPEEWYTTWQSRKLFGVEQRDGDDSSHNSYITESSQSSCDNTGSMLSGSVLSESVQTRETRRTYDSFGETETDYASTWDDYYNMDGPECGHIVNVKQKIGERVSRVNPYITSSLRRSRWRRKYFPRGTFPY